MAKEIEKVWDIGLSENPNENVLLESKYMRSHPCNCGGQWKRIGGGAAFPKYYYSECKCEQCGSEKTFIFYL